MTGNGSIFRSIKILPNSKITKVICLTDSVTTLPITSTVTILIKVGIYTIKIENFINVPQLDDTVFSVTEHIKIKNCSFTENNSKHILSFPNSSSPSIFISEDSIIFELVSHEMKKITIIFLRMSQVVNY